MKKSTECSSPIEFTPKNIINERDISMIKSPLSKKKLSVDLSKNPQKKSNKKDLMGLFKKKNTIKIDVKKRKNNNKTLNFKESINIENNDFIEDGFSISSECKTKEIFDKDTIKMLENIRNNYQSIKKDKIENEEHFFDSEEEEKKYVPVPLFLSQKKWLNVDEIEQKKDSFFTSSIFSKIDDNEN